MLYSESDSSSPAPVQYLDRLPSNTSFGFGLCRFNASAAYPRSRQIPKHKRSRQIPLAPSKTSTIQLSRAIPLE